MNQWFAYRHVNGETQVKRYFDPRDIEDARKSDFVDTVVGPFDAEDRTHALQIAGDRLGD